jgi:Pyruvate/2-oxoacid:ferredoxin oxidoreductase delta subunit
MKMGLHTIDETAEYMGITPEEAKENLERMASHKLLFWQYGPFDTKKRYRLIPYIHGIWEYNVDRIDVADAKNMGYYYVNGLADSLFDYRLPISRVVPIRKDTVKDGKLLPMDDMEAIIRQQQLIVVTDCACRKVAKFGRPCNCADTLNRCMFFGDTARYYLDQDIGNTKVLTADEAIQIVHENDELGLYLLTGHSNEPSAMCSCAPCHCGMLMAAKLSLKSGPKLGKQNFERWGNYKCTKDDAKCVNCGVCVSRCPMRAHKKDKEDETKIRYIHNLCIGCGLCVTKCKQKALILERKPDKELAIPEDRLAYDTFDRMALEKVEVDAMRAKAAMEAQ